MSKLSVYLILVVIFVAFETLSAQNYYDFDYAPVAPVKKVIVKRGPPKAASRSNYKIY